MYTHKKIPKILQIGTVKKNKTSGLSFSIPSLLKGFAKISVPVDFLNIEKNGLFLKYNGKRIRDYEIIVFHSFFIIQHLWILLKVSNKTRIIITPRGAFTNKNRLILRKKIYSFLYFKIIQLRKLAVKVHYLTEEERDSSVISNMSSFIVGNSIPSESIIDRRQNGFFNKKVNIVFMGRFHTFIKGLDILCNHLLANRDVYIANNIVFNLYGPESNDKRVLIDFVKENKIENVFFHEPVYGNEKIRVMDNSDFHIMTSRSEGFPMAVLESAARGCPQILSAGTNMLPLLSVYRFGFEFDENLPNRILRTTSEEYKKMTESAIECAKDHSNESIARKTYEEYIK